MKTGKFVLSLCVVCAFASGGLLFAQAFPESFDEAILYYAGDDTEDIYYDYEDVSMEYVDYEVLEKDPPKNFGEVLEKDVPYLSDEDEEAMQVVLPEDTPEDPSQPQTADTPKNQRGSSLYLYHLLVLDRMDCPSADIAADRDITVLYTFRHGANGYLITLYQTSAADAAAGRMLPNLPENSHIVLSLSAARRSTLKDFVNSDVFRRYVTHRTVIAELLKLL
jgi:hypothetical protein